jgi:hypothetical protein
MYRIFYVPTKVLYLNSNYEPEIRDYYISCIMELTLIDGLTIKDQKYLT